jgi:C-terminal processing protease CtpA/Prc
MDRRRRVPVWLAALLACSALGAAPAAAAAADGGPVRITGDFSYTNDIITTYYVEHEAALIDMHGFITRDLAWRIPVDSQILGVLSIDQDAHKGSYAIDLPIAPRGTLNDVDHDGAVDKGVEVFAATYWPNLTGGPYSDGNDPSFGWPTYLASVQTDSENRDEVIGGKLMIWAPDANQEIPSGYGPDGLLFTKDDPMAPAPAGWSVLDLDAAPFKQSTETTPSLTLYEPHEAAIKDYSKLSYTAAFDALFDSVSTNWAFNDIPSKRVNWAGLRAKVRPQVVAAEAANDAVAFDAALRSFILAIPDGHSGIFGDLEDQAFAEISGSGYGFSIVPLDDGRFVVLYVTPDGPAQAAGIRVGAVVTKFNGHAIGAAVAAVVPDTTASEASYRTYQQARYLLRAPVGTTATVTFANPGAKAKTVALKAVAERDSFRRTSLFFAAPFPTSPVEFDYLDADNGYIRINTNFDDLGLIIREFEYALKQFQLNGMSNVIIDMRYNSGGANLGLAGYLYDQPIRLGSLEYYSDRTKQFEPEGLPERVLPNAPQYHFRNVAVLVGPACASACELEAYGFAKIPHALVVGMSPSAGIEAEVSRGQYLLPEGIGIQIPTGRFKDANGQLFLEGTGVVPNLKVPVTLKNLLSEKDVVLATAVRALNKRLAAAAAG